MRSNSAAIQISIAGYQSSILPLMSIAIFIATKIERIETAIIAAMPFLAESTEISPEGNGLLGRFTLSISRSR